MSKTLIASAAILLIAGASADAQMLLYQDASDSKVVVNEWNGQTFDPIARERHNGAIREFAGTRYALDNPDAMAFSTSNPHRLPQGAYLLGEDANENKRVFGATSGPR